MKIKMNLKMKTKLRFSSIALLLVIFFAGSCKKENLTTLTAEGSVEFSYGVKSDKSTKANAKPFAALVSITDENDQTVVENQELKFYNINGSYLTEKLTLTAGNYKLSHYVIVSQTNEVIYATPVQGSELAYLVNTPLTIDIIVAEEQASQTVPEVIEVDDFTADQFGYSYFGLQKVKIFNFAIDLFTKNADTEVLSPATGIVTVTGDAVELFNGQLEAKTNAIYLRDGYTNYTVTIEKEGYTAYSKTFTVDELKEHSNAQGNNPLTVILDNNNNESVWFTVELPEAENIEFLLAGTGGENININWGDVSETTNHEFSNSAYGDRFAHSYSEAGTFTVKITGGINTITMFKIVTQDNITGLDISKVVNLELFSCTHCELTSLDVSNNPALKELSCGANKLENLDLTNNISLEILDCRENQLGNLVLNRNTNLKMIYCSGNQLNDLDLRNNPALEFLQCGQSSLINLDLSNCIALLDLDCGWSSLLSNLDISNNIALEKLNCQENKLINLDVSNNTALTYIDCNNNQLINLDVSNNSVLETLRCNENELVNIDVTNNNVLEKLWCYDNRLTELNIRNGNNAILSNFNAYDNPNLTTICVDDGFENGAIGWSKDDTANYSSTCQ